MLSLNSRVFPFICACEAALKANYWDYLSCSALIIVTMTTVNLLLMVIATTLHGVVADCPQ